MSKGRSRRQYTAEEKLRILEEARENSVHVGAFELIAQSQRNAPTHIRVGIVGEFKHALAGRVGILLTQVILRAQVGQGKNGGTSLLGARGSREFKHPGKRLTAEVELPHRGPTRVAPHKQQYTAANRFFIVAKKVKDMRTHSLTVRRSIQMI